MGPPPPLELDIPQSDLPGKEHIPDTPRRVLLKTPRRSLLGPPPRPVLLGNPPKHPSDKPIEFQHLEDMMHLWMKNHMQILDRYNYTK